MSKFDDAVDAVEKSIKHRRQAITTGNAAAEAMADNRIADNLASASLHAPNDNSPFGRARVGSELSTAAQMFRHADRDEKDRILQRLNAAHPGLIMSRRTRKTHTSGDSDDGICREDGPCDLCCSACDTCNSCCSCWARICRGCRGCDCDCGGCDCD